MGKHGLILRRLPDHQNSRCLELPTLVLHALSPAQGHAHRQGLSNLGPSWTGPGRGQAGPPHLERSYWSSVMGSVTTHSSGSSGQA